MGVAYVGPKRRTERAKVRKLVRKGSLRGMRVCRGKRVMETPEQARRALCEIAERTGRVLRPYRCGYCGKWHLTGARAALTRPTGRPKGV